MPSSRTSHRGSSKQERIPLLADSPTASVPRYHAIQVGSSDEHNQPLITRGAIQSNNALPRNGQSSSDLIVRVQAICPNIHCPSCILHLSNLVSNLDLDSSTQIRIGNVDTSLIDRSVLTDLIIPSTSFPDARSLSRLLIRICKGLASILAEDGFPVDHLRTRLVSATHSARKYKDALSLILDSPDLYQEEVPTAFSHSLPNDARIGMHRAATKSCSILGTFPASLGSTLRSAWTRSGDLDTAQQERWCKHLQICQACRDGDPGHANEHESSLIQSNRANSAQDGEVRHSSVDAEPDSRVLATLSISGMTCASCAQSITKAVQAEASIPIDSLDISILNASATVTTHPAALTKVIEAIDDAGFEAQVIKTEPIVQSRQQGEAKSDPQWNAKLSIEGMTCASCVQSITSALRTFSDQTNTDASVKILSTSVNLMGKSADVKLSTTNKVAEDKTEVEKRIREIIGEIDDIGFDAELLTMQPASANKVNDDAKGASNEDGSLQRSVRIRVDGMFCQDCMRKVREYFSKSQEHHPTDIEVNTDDLNAFSLAKPFLTFSYASGPNSKIRLRDILSDINRLDPTFDARYAPPASLASRSAVLARKELRDLLLRLSIAALFAIPALVISMIAPVLAPSHPLRRYLSQYVIGSATKGEVAMWLISSPVQFGVGSIFFKKAWRSLSSVWKRGPMRS